MRRALGAFALWLAATGAAAQPMPDAERVVAVQREKMAALKAMDGVWRGPGGRVNYVATIKDGKLREVGHTTLEGRPPLQTFEMNLERIGDTDWPLATPVPPK